MIKGKDFAWWHFSELEEADFEFLEKQFKFHPLDFDDLRDEGELAKIDEYKYYLLCIINLPVFDATKMLLENRNLTIFIGKDYIVTATRQPIDAVERFFARAKRSKGLRREAMNATTGFFLYRLLDYTFRDANVALRELVRESTKVEQRVYDLHTRVTTKRLGILRRNVLMMRQIIEPQRVMIGRLPHAKKSFLKEDLKIYFDDVQDTLNNMSVILENLKNIVEGLFDVNEAFLSHRTNEGIRILTLISVVLMPPTVLTGYYGMNVENLPFASNIFLVSSIVLFSIVIAWIIVLFIDRRH